MELIPAVDVLDGRCVRLYQGDYTREMVYSDDPAEVAAQWASLGVKRLHVVDLDGARSGAPVNLDVVRRIMNAVAIPVQLGGGMRTADVAREVLAMGVDRVIFGTVAIEAPEIVETVCRTEGSSSVVVSVDARDGYAAVRGWTEGAGVPASELVRRMTDGGVERVLYTDIGRDGTLTEPNFGAIRALLRDADVALLAAGGVSSLSHLLTLDEMGVEGAIVGRAAYTGDVDVGGALRALSEKRRC